jgi:hypothetical protein
MVKRANVIDQGVDRRLSDALRLEDVRALN